jgi:formate hydrogenlyase subunit 4
VVFAAAPAVVGACYGTLAFAVPWLGQQPLLPIDLITLVYLLALARFTLALAGLDSGAPFGALGSARMMFLSVPTELALILIGAALALHHHTLSIEELIRAQWKAGAGYLLDADLMLIALAMFLAVSLETTRLPIDNPATHLELTMSQKAVLLDYAGRDLALLEWAEAVKLALVIGLFSALFYVPLGTVPLGCMVYGGHRWLTASAVLLLMLLGPAGWSASLLLVELAKRAFKAKFVARVASRVALVGRFVTWMAEHPTLRMLVGFLAVLVIAGSLLYYKPFEACILPDNLWLPKLYHDKVVPISVAVFILSFVSTPVLAMVVGRLEIAGPKVRLRKTQGQAVLAAGLSLAAILYHVVQG